MRRDDDQMLLAFLRARKYKQPASFDVFLKFTTSFWFNPKYRHIIDGFNPDALRVYCVGSPSRMLVNSRDVMGNAVGLIYAGRMDAAFMRFDDMVRMGLLGFAWLLEHEDVQLRGVSYAETFENFSFWQAMKMRNVLSSDQQKELMNLFLNSFPFRIRGIYVIRQPKFFNIVWAVAKLFFKKKLVDRVHLLGETHLLHQYIRPEALPAEFGGTLVEAPDSIVEEIMTTLRARGSYGGFRVPFTVEDARAPTPEAEAAASAPAAATAGAGPSAPKGSEVDVTDVAATLSANGAVTEVDVSAIKAAGGDGAVL